MQECIGGRIQSVSNKVNDLPDIIKEKKKNLEEFVGKNVH